MADLTIYGFELSTYVRTVRMACEEKGITHEMAPIDLGSADHLALHPFGKMPSVRHGDFVLYEAGAIGRYIDRAFDGPPLQPKDIRALGVMDQWLSATVDYLYPAMVGGIVWQRVVVPSRGETPDEAAIAAALPNVTRQLDILETALESDYVAGEDVSLADLILVPIFAYLKDTPEGGPEIAKRPRVSAWYDRVADRASFAATEPPLFQAA